MPVQRTASAGANELVIILGDTASGQNLDENNPLVENNLLPFPIYYSLEGGARKTFTGAVRFQPAGLFLIPDDDDWIVTAQGVVFSPVWHEVVRGNQRYFLAPFIFEFIIEA